jgi:RNA polymerase sigma-70 factor (ECF subfamily)
MSADRISVRAHLGSEPSYDSGRTPGPLAHGRPLGVDKLGDHVDRLYRAAWALCGSREDAQDLVQETFARVLARPRFVRGGNDLGYLLVALRNTFLSRKRTDGRRPKPVAMPEHFEIAETRTYRDPVAALDAREVYDAVSSLPNGQRDVLVAVDLTGLSYQETAQALRLPVGTVMSRLHRARACVVQILDQGPTLEAACA